jgi:DNA-binding LytR/AlgR family response regulator
MEIPVVDEKRNTVHMIDVAEIIYITSDRNKITIQTHSGKYRPLLSLRDYHKLLNKKGFERTDKSTIAQISKVTRFDPVTRIAFFEAEGSQTKAVYVSRRNINKIKRLLL